MSFKNIHIRYWIEKLQILRHNFSRIFDASKPKITLRKFENYFQISVDTLPIYAPGPRRWRMYRRGIQSRINTVLERYGIADLQTSSADEWCIDVGGYIGEVSLGLLQKGFSVLIIEPDPIARECLNRNLKIHAADNARYIVESRLAYDKDEVVSFYSEPTNADSSIFRPSRYDSKSLQLNAARLDTIVSQRIGEQAKIKALKMDAEGAEPEVLNGATHILQKIEVVAIDAGFERNGDSTIEDCQKILKQYPQFLIIMDELKRDMVLAKIRSNSLN